MVLVMLEVKMYSIHLFSCKSFAHYNNSLLLYRPKTQGCLPLLLRVIRYAQVFSGVYLSPQVPLWRACVQHEAQWSLGAKLCWNIGLT